MHSLFFWSVFRKLCHAKRLHPKGAVHYLNRVPLPCGARQIHKPSLRQKVNFPAPKQILLNIGLYFLSFLRIPVQIPNVNLIVKVPGIAHNCAIFHEQKFLFPDYVTVACYSNENIPYFCSLFHPHYRKPVVVRLKCLVHPASAAFILSQVPIHLNNNNAPPHCGCPFCNPLAAPSVSRHHYYLPCNNEVQHVHYRVRVLCPVPYRLSKRCFEYASFTANTGNLSLPAPSIERSLLPPVVVSSHAPLIPSILPLCARSVRSHPSSMRICGLACITCCRHQ